MTPTLASGASADLVTSLLHPRTSPTPKGVLGNPPKASHGDCCLPGISRVWEATEHEDESLDPLAESAILNHETELYPKRKRELYSPADSQDRKCKSRIDSKQGETSILQPLDIPTSQWSPLVGNEISSDKRLRLHEPFSGALNGKTSVGPVTLPAELWQYIFCFVPPISLGLILRVNHAFHDYLDENQNGEELPALANSIVQPMKADAIWLASRRRFFPGLPPALHDLTEVAIWRLLRESSCQICGKPDTASEALSMEDTWRNGPGGTGVRTIWPFGIRTCISCLQDVTKTELELLLSSDFPSILLRGLSFAYVSDESHFISHTTMRQSAAVPSGLSLTKRYYKPHVESIKRRFNDAQILGGPSAEEWIKELAEQGRKWVDATIRWEQYEAKGQLKEFNAPQATNLASGTTAFQNIAPSRSAKTDTHLERTSPCTLGLQTTFGRTHVNPISPKALKSSFIAQNAIRSYQATWIGSSPFPGQVHSRQSMQNHQPCQPKPERTIRDVNEAKAARHVEIERRCAALDPPIPSKLLNHMESFYAALQISQPMTDSAWQVLKPRLLAQLPYADRREQEQAQEAKKTQEEFERQRQQEAQSKDTKNCLDREWEIYQGPVRNNLAALSDDVIYTRWSNGKSLTKENSPKFAADVLLQVRQRYYAELTKDDKANLASGAVVEADLANRPPVRSLVLENMKWVFDNKIKPLTDHFQKELFLCHDCDGNFKFYGFEGVIQHFAAKHTTELSMGNIVVHWRAEWPDHSPFHPNPSLFKTAFYKLPAPTSAPGSNTSLVESANNASTSNDSLSIGLRAPDSISEGRFLPDITQHLLASSTVLQALPCPLITSGSRQGVPAFQTGFTGIHASNHVPTAQSIPSSQSQVSPVYNNSNSSSSSSLDGTVASYAPPSQGPSCGTFVSQPPTSNSTAHTSDTSVISPTCTMPTQQSDLYICQMEEMARNAKDVFLGLGSVKDIPGSVRVFVTIQHTVARFRATFAQQPTLQMFIDGLDHNATMRPVRSVNGIACKVCVGLGTAAEFGPQNHGKVVGDRRLYTLPHLIYHFRAAHVDPFHKSGTNQSNMSLAHDWRNDMIELPDISVISSLARASGMTGSKLALISAVLPEAFDPRSVVAGTGTLRSCPNSIGICRIWPPAPLVSSEEVPGDEEYDPLKPAILHKPVTIDSAPHVPANHGSTANSLFEEHNSQRDCRKEHRSPVSDDLLTGQSAEKTSLREVDGKAHYNPHRYAALLYRTDSTLWSRDTDKRDESLCITERPSRKVMDEMEHFCEPSKEHVTDGRGLVPVRRRQSPPAGHGEDVVTERGPGMGPSLCRTSTHEWRIMDQERHEQQPHYLGGNSAKNDWWQDTNQRRRGSDDFTSLAHRREASPMQYHNPLTQQELISQTSCQEGWRSSYKSKPLKATGLSEDRDSGAYTRSPRVEVQALQISPMSQGRARSRSPYREAPETALYRTRSLVEEDRGLHINQVQRSPSRRNRGVDRPMDYEYGTCDQIDCVDGRIVERRYQPQVKHPTSRTELPTKRKRYDIAGSTGRFTQSGHVDYELAAEEPFYDIDGRLFPVSQLRYAEALGRATTSYTQECRY